MAQADANMISTLRCSDDAKDAIQRVGITDRYLAAIFGVVYDEEFGDSGWLSQEWARQFAEKIKLAITPQA